MNQALQESQFDNKGALWPFLKRIFGYSLKYKNWLLGFGFWVAIVSVCDAVYPLLFLGLIDYGISPQLLAWREASAAGLDYAFDMSEVYKYIIYFALVGLAQITGVFFFIRYAGRMQEHVITDLRLDMFKKLQKLSFSYYDKSATGWLITRMTSDTDKVSQIISWGALDAVWGTVMVIFCISALLFYAPLLALVVIIAVPVMMVLSIKIRLLVLKYARKSRKINSELTASYNEHINGVKVNKSTAQEDRVSFEFSILSGKMRGSSYKAAYYTAMYIPIVIFVGSIAAATVIFLGGKMTVGGVITVGALIAGYEYAVRIFMPILDLSMFYAHAQDSLSAGERIFSLLDETDHLEGIGVFPDLPEIKGEVEFKQVDFSYDTSNPVLNGFDLKIKEGQSIAIVGATGEGKSTIINLIGRFYEPNSGSILIDGHDYLQYSLGSLRRQMGIVLQKPHLFEGTIRDNLRYGNLEATDEMLGAALEAVSAEQFFSRLDEGVGEGGDNLSVGEKQLISFARALLAQPRIFIMDEATSSIDTITETAIQKGIATLLEGRTSVIIAHRLSTIKNCDRILVLEKGKILEDGSHDSLIDLKGKYYQLYTKQLRQERVR